MEMLLLIIVYICLPDLLNSAQITKIVLTSNNNMFSISVAHI